MRDRNIRGCLTNSLYLAVAGLSGTLMAFPGFIIGGYLDMDSTTAYGDWEGPKIGACVGAAVGLVASCSLAISMMICARRANQNEHTPLINSSSTLFTRSIPQDDIEQGNNNNPAVAGPGH